MGFSHVKKGSELQEIWTYFHTMRSKNIDVCRRQLTARMNRWAHDRHIPIDTSVYLEGTTIKAIMELKFNPGEGVAHLSSADKGLSIMACRSRTSTETEQIREREDTLLATENTWQLDELLRLSKGVTRAPADNFWELKINIRNIYVPGVGTVWVGVRLLQGLTQRVCNSRIEGGNGSKEQLHTGTLLQNYMGNSG